MVKKDLCSAMLVAVVAMTMIGGGAEPAMAQPMDIKKPEPTVPEVFTILGEFVRVAYNNEGYVTLTYRVANQSAGEEWMLLDVGMTVRREIKGQDIRREQVSLITPDGKTIPMATQSEYSKARLKALDKRANRVPETPNYFPAHADQLCRIGFFTDVSRSRGASHDTVNLSRKRACVGRVYFHVPGGIQTGQHFLQVQFANSTLQVPFRILTKEEEKEFRHKWKDVKKWHEAGLAEQQQ